MRFIATIFFVFFAMPAFAKCACSVIPDQGTYTAMGTDVQLSYVRTDADRCPTEIQLKANPPERPPVNVVLTCEGGGFAGTEPTQVGTFVWRIDPQISESGVYAAGLASAETITMTLEVPAQMKKIGKRDRSAVLTRRGKGRAAECICQNVRDELEHAEAMRDAFGDKKALADAKAKVMGGKYATMKYYLDDKGVLQKFPKRTARHKTYKQDALDRATAALDAKWAKQGYEAVTDSGSGSAPNSVDSDGVQSGASASTDSVSCKVNMPGKRKVVANCTPTIVLKAWEVHENTHAKQCNAMKGKPIKIWDGNTVTLVPGARLYDVPAPASNYDAYTQLPANLAKSEVAAYSAEIKVYKKFLKNRCQ